MAWVENNNGNLRVRYRRTDGTTAVETRFANRREAQARTAELDAPTQPVPAVQHNA